MASRKNANQNREDALFQCFENAGFTRLEDESDKDAAVRLFREYWPSHSDLLLQVLSCCCKVAMEELATLAEGTLWLGDEPGISPPPEDRTFQSRERFLMLALGPAYSRPKTLTA